jgi:hypothetical protein
VLFFVIPPLSFEGFLRLWPVRRIFQIHPILYQITDLNHGPPVHLSLTLPLNVLF